MSVDDELRAALHREFMARGEGTSAPIALGDAQSALARVTYRRLATRVASVVLLVGAAGATTQLMRPSTNAVQMDAPSSGLEVDTTGRVDEHDARPVDGDSTDRSDADESDDHSGATPVGTIDASDGEHDAIDDTPPPMSVDRSESDDDNDPEDNDPEDYEATSDDDPVATPAPIVTQPPPSTTSAATTAPPPTAAPAPTTVAAAQQVKTFTVTCGTVTADIAPVTPTIFDITVADGYDYRLEDPERGRVVVQFEGDGEDCELKITSSSWSGGDD